MVHERDEKYDGQDDSEYHFSDDQLSYEPEADLKSTSSRSGKPDIMAKIIYYKRPLIGVGIFLVLIFLVYKIIAPSSVTAPTTDFSQNNAPTTTQVTETTKTKTTTIEPATTMKVVTPVEPQPAPTTTAPNLAPTVDQTVQTQQVAPVPQQTMAPPVAVQQQPAQQTITTEVPPSGAPSTVTTTIVTQQPTGAPPVVMPATAAMSLPDRLTVLETQNAKLQSDYTQKTTEQEAQNVVLQGKLQDLNMRMASIEATLIRLGRMMHEMKGGKSIEDVMGGGAEPVRMMAKPAPSPRVTYSVQAIIPGRAWLKSESGETVTVAEGDVVKDLGRITKIDPYDGVVQIDSSGRLISLSYGASAEQ